MFLCTIHLSSFFKKKSPCGLCLGPAPDPPGPMACHGNLQGIMPPGGKKDLLAWPLAQGWGIGYPGGCGVPSFTMHGSTGESVGGQQMRNTLPINLSKTWECSCWLGVAGGCSFNAQWTFMGYAAGTACWWCQHKRHCRSGLIRWVASTVCLENHFSS